MPDTVLSTPLSKRHCDLLLPSTPNKDTKKGKYLQENLDTFQNATTPSKSFRFARHNPPKKLSFGVKRTQFKPTIIIPLEIPQTGQTHGFIDDSNYDGVLSQRLDSESPTSDLESISPLSEISPLPSLSPNGDELKNFGALRDTSLNWNENADLHHETFKLNEVIHSKLFGPTKPTNESSREACQEESIMNSPPILNKDTAVSATDPSMREPKHRFSKPERPILSLGPGYLNMIVSAGNGSLDDATIYATEINATVSKSENKIPVISNVWERITIPVNNSIKERHKQIKKNQFGEFYDLNEENEGPSVADSEGGDPSLVSTEDDVALIRGFEFKTTSGKQSPCEPKMPKSVKWAEPLTD
ncbi:Sfg1p KNAG_0G03230 [Huiozyma naganishii CBS 8797]|uniref:Uncharacterized protein n=1 Tax=Huiozyma naganishii (strain ATCC MYA-139 / BCRC 22969 / CBS 8797 / KCTC 17520 / NBRC 10181 / NCYC 3082 / Yp74L-3) TaxID=1071383 RepID=J7R931_HUIN7|nr:hypothetical protein KNAG_0G03230 [Kazachstania naganishii CBS 8797]CCK71380.1 hypothetical protein KNAG_0G03230 [Kazachstania naganishii CBS 8797]